MKKLIALILSLIICFSLTACFPSNHDEIDDTPKENLPAPETFDELYGVYSVIDRGMSREEITALFGEPTAVLDDYGEPKYWNYFNETKSAGATIVFDNDNIIRSKTLFFNTKKNLIPFSGRFDKDSVNLLKKDMPVEKASEIIGASALELSCQYGDGGPLNAKKIFCWYNEDGSNLMIHTENGIIKNIVFYHE